MRYGGTFWWIGLTILGAALALGQAVAADNAIPPRPSTYVFDPGQFLPATRANQLNLQLAEFERKTSDQVVVAIFPDLPEGESLEDFTQRTAEAWQVGQKGRDNGVILFIFVQPHKVRIEVGYGLEGVLPDITAHRIITEDIIPAFKAGNFKAGVTWGVHSILAAIQGEYKGTGKTAAEQQPNASDWIPVAFFVLIVFIVLFFRNRGGYMYGPFGGSSVSGTPFLGPFDNDDRGDRGGGGGFRGGGGGFGGGGASGGW